MNNVIELRVQLDTLSGYEIVEGREGAYRSMYLGSVDLPINIGPEAVVAAGITDAMKKFNLPTARAPGHWPNVHGAIEARVQAFNDRELR